MSRVAEPRMFVGFETVADRPGRIYARSEEQLKAGRAFMQESYVDPDTIARLRSIEAVCSRLVIFATAHRDSGGRYHLFITNSGIETLPSRLFACVVRSEDEAFAEVDKRGFHVESLDEIFVGNALEMKREVLEAVLRAWIVRCYPKADPVSVSVEIFSESATS